MRSLLLVIAIVAVVGGPFWLGSGVHAHGSIPQAYQRDLPPEVAQWEVSLGTREAPAKSLGPIPIGGIVDQKVLELLGDRDSLGSASNLGHRTYSRAYFGLGLSFFSVGELVRANDSDAGQILVIGLVLGNPWAMSAEDPIVKACPFKLPNGITFGMGIEEVEKRLGDLVPHTYHDGYSAWRNRVGGATVIMPCGTFHYMNGQLVALVLGK